MARRHAFAVAGLALAVVAGAGATTAAPSRAPGLTVFRFVDHGRVARFRNGTARPRTLVTYVRYPRLGRGPFPLVVFGHGFAVTPGLYARLLDAWTRAGYVVAAPLFPVENANAPGGPDESDLINQPGDMSFVISRMLAANASVKSPLHGLIDPTRIAVGGQSDGGETALAVAYDSRFLDARVRAAVILSGAEIPGRTLRFGPGSPPLLAVQGTDDKINPPRLTEQFFQLAPRPKFLLALLGAGHLPPYSTNDRQLTVVERVTIAFLDRYLEHGTLQQLLAAGRADGVARLTADP
jgi:dienelactone hydrolase